MEKTMRFSGALWMEAIRMLTAIILVTTALTLSRPAGAQAEAPMFVADQEACFGRVYDRAHLLAHPNQTVTSLHIFRYLGERPEAENWQASQRDEAIKRFHRSELFCFGRDYDAAHLAKHPQQKVASIRVGRLNPEAERRNMYPLGQKWPDDVKLSVALTVKAATTRRALTYVCNPREASWECTAESVPDAASSCDGDTIHLARGRDDDILLINRKEGLPIDAPCQGKQESEPNGDYQQATRSDDRTFRLVRMPIEACR
jgi:hypothetical protein